MEQEGLNGWKVVAVFFEDTVINDSTLGRPQFFKSLGPSFSDLIQDRGRVM